MESDVDVFRLSVILQEGGHAKIDLAGYADTDGSMADRLTHSLFMGEPLLGVLTSENRLVVNNREWNLNTWRWLTLQNWLDSLIQQPFGTTLVVPTTLYSDNQSAIDNQRSFVPFKYRKICFTASQWIGPGFVEKVWKANEISGRVPSDAYINEPVGDFP